MKFVLMLVQDARAWDEEPQPEKDRVFNEHMRVYAQMGAQGKAVDRYRTAGRPRRYVQYSNVGRTPGLARA